MAWAAATLVSALGGLVTAIRTHGKVRHIEKSVNGGERNGKSEEGTPEILSGGKAPRG